jgi:hypothetical protein
MRALAMTRTDASVPSMVRRAKLASRFRTARDTRTELTMFDASDELGGEFSRYGNITLVDTRTTAPARVHARLASLHSFRDMPQQPDHELDNSQS